MFKIGVAVAVAYSPMVISSSCGFFLIFFFFVVVVVVLRYATDRRLEFNY